jgi:hypothetical protein
MKNIILLTATITPKQGVPNLKRVDPNQRMEDYRHALDSYLPLLGSTVDGIVFSENSNTDISILRNLIDEKKLSDKVEFIVFDGLDYPPHYDRAYGEFKLLDHTMQKSEMICNHRESAVIWKITGRYKVTNLSQIILSQPSTFDIYCNFRNHPKFWVDTFLMAWTAIGYELCLKGIYEHLKTNVPEVPLGLSGEELLRSHLEKVQAHSRIVKRFKKTPFVSGTRGADNREYSTDNLWKTQVRSVASVLFPWIWI